MKETEVRVIRSKRRRKTVSATMDRGAMVLRIPARMSKKDEAYWINHMREKLQSKRSKKKGRSNEELEERARRLAQDYFGGLEFTIVWSKRQKQRWGSCTPLDQSIRLSTNL